MQQDRRDVWLLGGDQDDRGVVVLFSEMDEMEDERNEADELDRTSNFVFFVGGSGMVCDETEEEEEEEPTGTDMISEKKTKYRKTRLIKFVTYFPNRKTKQQNKTKRSRFKLLEKTLAKSTNLKGTNKANDKTC